MSIYTCTIDSSDTVEFDFESDHNLYITCREFKDIGGVSKASVGISLSDVQNLIIKLREHLNKLDPSIDPESNEFIDEGDELLGEIEEEIDPSANVTNLNQARAKIRVLHRKFKAAQNALDDLIEKQPVPEHVQLKSDGTAW